MASSQRSARFASLRQIYLGSSAQNRLTIVDLHKSIPTEEPFIFRLPDELLATVLELATLNIKSPGWRSCDCVVLCEYAAIKLLALICRRFNRIVLPLLYRTIRFNTVCQVAPPGKAVKALHSTLQNNTSLWQYCQALSICIGDSGGKVEAEHFSMVNNFASCLTRVRCLVCARLRSRETIYEDLTGAVHVSLLWW
jgi:hypothetical protein